MVDTIPETIRLDTFDVLINKFIERHDCDKQITPNFSDPPKRQVNDGFTDIISKYMTETPNIINNMFFIVNSIFGDYDISNLKPKLNIAGVPLPNLVNNPNVKLNIPNIVEGLPITNTNNYKISDNKFNDEHGTYKGYFVFKGGNAIKYWTQKKYMIIQHIVDGGTIESTISQSINDTLTDGFKFGFSDFDFSYYTNNEFTDNEYKKLIKHTLIRMYKLRDHLERQIMFDGVKQLFDDGKLHAGIQLYFNDKDNGHDVINKRPITFHQQIEKPHIINDYFVTKHDDHNNITLYKTPSNNFMHISANNSIITVYKNDFDLYRIKMDFDVTNNVKKDIFAGEVFDLTIMRPSDIHKNDFCNNIEENTKIITNIFGSSKENLVNVRVYTIYYVLLDLFGLLFIRNKYKTIFSWIDKKYNKRVQRLGVLYANYLDELKTTDHEGSNYKFGFFSLLFLMFFNHNFNIRKNELFKSNLDQANAIYDDIINQSFVMIGDICEHKSDLPYPDREVNKIKNIIREPIVPHDTVHYLYGKLSEFPGNPEHKENLFSAIIKISTTYIKKVFIERDINWCTINYGNRIDPTDDQYYDIRKFHPIDIHDFSIKISEFLNTFIKYTFIGINMQTNILRDLHTHGALIKQIREYTHTTQVGGTLKIQTQQHIPLVGQKDMIYEKGTQNNTTHENDMIYKKDKIYEESKKNVKKLQTISYEKAKQYINDDTKIIIKCLEKLNKNYNKILYDDVDNMYYEYDKLNKPVKKVPKLIINEIYNDDNKMIEFVKTQNRLYNILLGKHEEKDETLNKSINNDIVNFF